MKIQYLSDLHLEFHENSRWLKENPLITVGDVLLLAGDIGYLGDDNYAHHPFWDWCAESFRRTIVIPGNHELYKSFDINDLHEGWQQEIRRISSSVLFLSSSSAHLESISSRFSVVIINASL